jgi:dipeptidyl aminopeptidase/acylaminoacyl peptidase
MRNYTFRVLLAAPFALVAVSAAQTPDAFPSNEVMRHYRTMGDPRLSPDGTAALIQVHDSTADGGKGHLWLVPVDGGEPRQLTYSPEGDKRGEGSGQWMPDGKSILFLAHRGEHTTLFRLPMAGGEAKPIEVKVAPLVDASKLPDAIPPAKADATPTTAGAKPAEAAAEIAVDIANYRVSPDGKWIALTAADPETPGEKQQKDAKADSVWVDHDLHGSRLYLLEVATDKVTHVPVPPDVDDIAWSRDSAQLLAVADAPNNLDDLGPAKSSWLVQLSDLQHPAALSALPPSIETAVWSFDGHSIFYIAQAARDTPPGFSDLYSYEVAGKTSRNLSDGLDTPALTGSIAGGPIPLVSGGVLQPLESGVTLTLASFAAGRRQPEVLQLPAASITGVSTNATQSGWLLLGSSGGHPPTLYFTDRPGSPARALRTPPLVPDHTRSIVPKRIQWKNDGLTIDGLLYLPPEAATGRVPLVVEVHGGPLGAYSDRFAPLADFILGHGWAVLQPNPRGSTGRGAAFAAANKNDLGGGDYRDIMAGVDFVLKTEAIDPAKMALIGYSYGGEMAGFVEGKTDRFKAIVSGAPVIDQYSEYGTESASWYDRWYFGKPWEHPADAWRQSPLSGVPHAKTPFLLLQGEADSTDPLGQSLEMYRALRQAGVPVDLVTYPRDDHGPLANALYGNPVPEPWHGFDARQRMIAFIEKAFK